jgi:hypothetical protein
VLTLFTIPKPFRGEINVIQRNAIRSWSFLHPGCEIILCGDEPGTEETTAEFKVKWIPSVARNKYGTPLLDSVFDRVQKMASHDLMCYVNADIILLSDFVRAVQRIHLQKFLMVGQRWDVNLTRPWDFDQPNWEERLRKYVADHGTIHPPLGSDYFVFPQDNAIGKLPRFAVGRPGWDNWFIYRARKLGMPVVDVTRVVTVVHQNHDYGHVPNQRDETWEGPEADWNRKLVGGRDYIFTLLDATHVMTPSGLLPALGYKYLRRRWQTLSIMIPGTRRLARFQNMVRLRLQSWYGKEGSR